MFPLDNIITFLTLSIGNYKDVVLKHLLDQLRLESAAIIGVPEWTEKDLRFCFRNGNGNGDQQEEQEESSAGVPDMLLKIHLAIVGYSQNLGTRYTPTPAMLSLAYKVE